MRRDTILIVDDEEINRAILRAQFEQEYDFMEAENGEQAIMLIRQYRDLLAGVLLDLVMPIKNGYEVMVDMNQSGLINRIPVVVITSEESMENEIRAFDLGASDIIIKPFEPHVVRRRVQNAVDLNKHRVHLEEMVEEQAEKLRESRDVIMDTLSSVIEHRSAETGQHVLRIRMFTKVLMEEVFRSCPEYHLTERVIGVIAEASALHDVGKISIPDTILNKPGRLTDEEYEIMKSHTVKGCEILESLERMGDEEYLTFAYDICRYHHERWDGRGYPDGLAGDNIPIYAQVVGIADCYDALTTDRVYRKALPSRQAANMILNGECGQFSPKLLECFKNVEAGFSDLAVSYADGQPLEKASGMAPRRVSPLERDLQTSSDTGHDKYFAMLRYVDSTVLEVDLNLGSYHLVYQENEDFDALRSSGNFEEVFREFVEQSVHPDDRAGALESIGGYIDDFFSRGLMKCVRTYRVFHRASGSYIPCEVTALRVNIDNPKNHRLLIIWRMADSDTVSRGTKREMETVGVPTMPNLPVGVQQCLGDQWFTITYVNTGFCSLFGYQREELKSRFNNHYIEMIHPEDQQNVRRQFSEQVRSSGILEMEYRVLSKQGQIIWVLDKCRVVTGEDGREYLNCVLTDITQVKQAQEELRLSMERYQIITNQTNDIIFEWDIRKDKITYSPNWEKLFGYKALDVSALAQTASHILPEDIPVFMELRDSIAGGTPYGEAEVRIAKGVGRYCWCRIRATTQFDRKGRPVKAVGVILNIDAEKRQTQALTTKAEMDALTQLYNKAAAKEKIQQLLDQKSPSDQFAMFLIDMDNFKLVNDSRGHMFGDAILTEASSHLRALFRAGDIVSRFGGDEFLIFLQHTSDKAFIRDKASKIIEMFHHVFSEDLPDFLLTCSMGIVRCPEDGEDYHTLFQRCDQALYEAKRRGKDRFVFYDRATMKKVFGLDPNQFAAGTRIESDDTISLSVDSLVPMAFRLLYESNDVETAVNAIMEMAGRKYNVSRVYIFEDSEDGLWSRNTFEWCNEGIEPAIQLLQHVDYDRLGGNYREHFNENGIFYCKDVSKLSGEEYEILASQKVRSMLQCAVRDKGKFVGFIGFDDCIFQRTWTQEQIDALAFMSELIATFLLKKRAQDRTAAAARDLRMILDNQNSWIYVIHPDTFVLNYINDKTQRTVPDARVGTRCYEAFFHRDTPCEQCPARDIRSLVNQTLEVYNPILDVWSIADASLIRWGEEEACLLACHDISKYKKAEETASMLQEEKKERGQDGRDH